MTTNPVIAPKAQSNDALPNDPIVQILREAYRRGRELRAQRETAQDHLHTNAELNSTTVTAISDSKAGLE